MKSKLSLRTYAECIRPYMKKKSVFKPNVGRTKVKNAPIDGQGIHAFYSMLLDSLTNNVSNEDLDELPDVTNAFTTHLKSGETDIHNKFVELAQRDTAVQDVEAYFAEYLIPNIPNESLDTVNDAVMNLISNDDSIGVAKQVKFNENRLNNPPERFHAEVLIFVVQRNQNKIELITDTKSDKSKDKTVVYALNQLERRMGRTDFRELEAACENNHKLIFRAPRGGKSQQNMQKITLIGEFCRKYSPLMIYGKGGCGKTSLIQSAIMEIHLSVKCKYICFSDIYKAVKNGSISNTDNFLHTYMDADVLFLDGISEMTPNGFDYSDFITEKVCGIIRDLCCNYNDIQLIITGCFSNRKEASAVTNLISSGFHLVEIKGVSEDEHIRMICSEKGRAFSELVKRPLYYNTYKALNIESVKKLKSYSRYSLLSLLYEQMRQRCGMKSICPMNLDEIIYRKIPKLAYAMLLEPYQKPIPSNYGNGFEFVATNLDFIFSKHIDAEGQSWFSFEHQDYRDFLAAMYFRNCVDDLRSFVPIQLSVYNFSALSDTTITMIIEATDDFVISDEDFSGISKENNLPDKKNWWKKYEIINSKFENIQEYMSIGFEVGYYLADPLRHMHTDKNIYFEGYEKLISHYFTIIEYNIFGLFPLKSDAIGKGIVEKVLRKHIELLRRSKSFEEAFICLNQLISWDSSPNLELLNQKAKLLMYKAQYSEKGADKDFIEGYELLKECAKNGSIMSNNLLGRIYASPSPIVIRYLGEGIRDNKKGFLHFYNNIKLTQTKKCLTPYEKYSYVRCAKMLLHGNISILSVSPTLEIECVQSYVNFNRPEPLSIKYAEIFLKHANDSSAYALYLQGVVDYYRSDLTSAISKFKIVIAREMQWGKILPLLFLYQIYSADIAPDGLLKLEDEIIEKIHSLSSSLCDVQSALDFELYHPQYILEDIRYVLKCLDKTDNAIRAKGVQL